MVLPIGKEVWVNRGFEILTSEKKLPGSMGDRPGGAAAPSQLLVGLNRSPRA
jgi:hypothetical protein